MSSETLASLDSYKKDARRLKKAHRNGDPDAIRRVSVLIGEDRALKHADFLHVIACEAGYGSWPKLKFGIESAAMSRAQKAERLKTALYFGQHWVTEKLLSDDPSLKDANFGIQCALGDLEAVKRTLQAAPSAATAKIGIRSPLLHLCFSKEVHRHPEIRDNMIEIAHLLVENGADVNEGYPPEQGSEHRLSALYGAMCHADNFPLGKWLLENGADPNDDESLYHATELGETKALEHLLKHGAKPDGTNALPRALDFDNLDMVRLLLEAGADPNITVPDHPSGQPMNTVPSLHQAVQRGRGAETIELLLSFGADAKARWQGHTAFAWALIHANTAAADKLADLGFAAELSSNEEILAACARGETPSRKLDLHELSSEDRALLTKVSGEPGHLAQIRALVAAGLDPNEPDQMGLPPLQTAGWVGLAEEVKFYLTLDPDLTHKNAFGGDALETVLHGSEFAPWQSGSNHIDCARLLLEAGSLLSADVIGRCGNEEMAGFLETWVEDHPEALSETLAEARAER